MARVRRLSEAVERALRVWSSEVKLRREMCSFPFPAREPSGRVRVVRRVVVAFQVDDMEKAILVPRALWPFKW